MLKAFASLGSRLLEALMPEECVVCGRQLVDGERFVCLHCLADLPRLGISSLTDNPMHESLATTRPVNRAVAWFRYRKGSPYTRLVHNAKYNSRPHLARWLGMNVATAFLNKGMFEGVDALVPVPLNSWKLMRRGFNQSAEIARGISKVTGIPVADILTARRHSTQTRKNALNRRLNAQGIYGIKSSTRISELRHVILVDDVVTTGSTILSCADVLRAANPTLTVSVASAALTEL